MRTLAIGSRTVERKPAPLPEDYQSLLSISNSRFLDSQSVTTGPAQVGNRRIISKRMIHERRLYSEEGLSTANTAFRFRKVTGLSWNVSSDARRPDSERSLTEVKCDFVLLLLRTWMWMRRNHGTNTAHHNRQECLRANLKVRCRISKPGFLSSDSTSQK